MIQVCQQGIAVAMVEYRPSEVAPFPAQVQDAKTAIHFMRKNMVNGDNPFDQGGLCVIACAAADLALCGCANAAEIKMACADEIEGFPSQSKYESPVK